MIAVAFALLLQGGAAAPPDAGVMPVQMGITLTPDTVAVGDPFVLRVRVRAPRGATMQFPAGPDSGGAVEGLDPVRVERAADSASADETAIYRLVAWDVGDQPLLLPDVMVRVGTRTRVVSFAGTQVFVRSVLPVDSAQRVPKPPRDVLAQAPPWWRSWIAALALAVLALLLLLWWLWRRRRRRGGGAAPAVDPLVLAEREFARVEALGLLEAGERGRFVALMVEVLRDYLAARVTGAHPALTSTELLHVVRRHEHVPADRLAAVLHESDLIKFARRSVAVDRARELAREARTIVRETDARLAAAAAAPHPGTERAA